MYAGMGAQLYERDLCKEVCRASHICNLYEKTRKPMPEVLAGLSAVVIDLQDVGSSVVTRLCGQWHFARGSSRGRHQRRGPRPPQPAGRGCCGGPAAGGRPHVLCGVPQLQRPYLTIAEIARIVVVDNTA